jgi:ParB family chromosome partitioning protein
VSADANAPAKKLASDIEADGGVVLSIYRDPLGGNWQVFAALPLERVKPTPFQRDLSDSHVERLTKRIAELDRFLDPIIAVRQDDGEYWTPNGNHRRASMEKLGARSISAIVIPEREMMFKILALNTEKAHNLREKALEVIRMARGLSQLDPRLEKDFEVEFEEPQFLTLGLCYEQRGRFAGGAYSPALKRCESFLAEKLPRALETRALRAAKLFELDDAVTAAIAALKSRGFESPYLRAFVVARVNPLRFVRGTKPPDWDETIDKMIAGAKKFDAAKIKADQIAASGGAASED